MSLDSSGGRTVAPAPTPGPGWIMALGFAHASTYLNHSYEKGSNWSPSGLGLGR